jgi:hypothetical protein
MDKFIKENFNYDGMYLTYGTSRKFVARFKYIKYCASFKSFLIKNFSVSEYFDAYDSGTSPLDILESKGFMTPHAKKLCKQNNMIPTLENYKICVHAQFKAWEAQREVA